MRYYVTSPIYYVNDKPHIGHAYTSIACDIIARFQRLSGKEVRFMTGTDEHGQKIQKSAQNADIDPQEFVDKVSENFRELANKTDISYDTFLRTTSENHKKCVKHVWSELVKGGHIYLGKYAGWYSVRDEAFYQESELDENRLAPSGSAVEWVEEPCYFFALSKWQKPLLDFYAANPDFVKPVSRFNEVISFVKSGLQDLAVSRKSITWGIPVPDDEEQVIYVWLDALTCYISSLGIFDKEGSFKEFWPANVHIVGKDILRFHAVYWPAFLMALGLQPPKQIMAHGWWTNEGVKMSKSLNNTIDPMELVKDYSTDYLRYFLFREISFGEDGNFSKESFINRVNNELNNKIGNLCQRVLSFIFNKCEGQLQVDSVNDELFKNANELLGNMQKHMQNFALHLMLEAIINLADQSNKYMEEKAPWTLMKSDRKAAEEALFVLVEVIRYIAISLQPFLPESANKILDQLGVPQDQRKFSCLSENFALRSFKINALPTPVFAKIC
ncbi:methionyl-tRNA synthetase [Candidatus Phycorickettsia trachydisci]|uniref:Methionine--tRNA ligase n=1 Tax=Candidatus Phycorickettsia trachydisci TaxID=2115978 RepID=A0A2P1P6W4_9RICK|nr:methionine--tRNA ligase [Candidatus Phycorickettsia trachydisci]AVP87013.1 methionyl-tRNA synthetase [Candidatus Phycorickettsia trachydisci]